MSCKVIELFVFSYRSNFFQYRIRLALCLHALWRAMERFVFSLMLCIIDTDKILERRRLFHKEFTPPATLLHRPRELEATRKALVKFLDNPDGDYLSKFR